jgi:hypothetical protein
LKKFTVKIKIIENTKKTALFGAKRSGGLINTEKVWRKLIKNDKNYRIRYADFVHF